MYFFKNSTKKSGHIAQGNQQLKFERNPCNRFRDKDATSRRTDGRTDRAKHYRTENFVTAKKKNNFGHRNLSEKSGQVQGPLSLFHYVCLDRIWKS